MVMTKKHRTLRWRSSFKRRNRCLSTDYWLWSLTVGLDSEIKSRITNVYNDTQLQTALAAP
jgi:hypothetical protein